MRKDGTLFDARMYVSPADRPQGPADRLDDQRSPTSPRPSASATSSRPAHERFTTVLEGLDASVSVLSVQQGELLFANRSLPAVVRRRRARPRAAGRRRRRRCRLRRATTTTTSTPCRACRRRSSPRPAPDPREVFVESLQKWFDVRARYLQWTDGRLAQMLIATDITARLRAEEQAAHAGREGAGDEPAGDDGRDGLARWRTS